MPSVEGNALWQKARAIVCPTCKAQPGEPCKYTSFLVEHGNEMRTHHKARYDAVLRAVAKPGDCGA